MLLNRFAPGLVNTVESRSIDCSGGAVYNIKKPSQHIVELDRFRGVGRVFGTTIIIVTVERL